MTKWKGVVASFAPYIAQLVMSIARVPVRGAAALMLAGGLASPALALDLYWDPNGTNVGLGGAGTWNTSSATWSPYSDGVGGEMRPWSNAVGDVATFAGTAGTVTVGAVTANSLRFDTGGYTLTGGTLTLAGTTPTIFVAGGTPTAPVATIASTITGSGFNKIGGGMLTLSGANSFTGDLNINAGTLNLAGSGTYTGNINLNNGTLIVANDAALGNSSNGIFTTAGTQLTINGALNAGRLVTLGAGQTTITGAGAASTRYTGAGGLISGTSLTNNANDYTGKTSVQVGNGAVVNFSSVGNLGEKSALGAASDPTLGTISVQRVGGATGYFSYTGAASQSDRDWDLSAAGGHLVFSNTGSGTLTLGGNIALSGTAGTGVIISAASADLALLGQIGLPSGSLASVSFSGSGSTRTITLGNANSFNAPVTIGAVTVKAATLADGGMNSSLGAGTSVALNNGGILSYEGGAASSNRTWTFDGATTISNDGLGGLSLSGAGSFVPGGVDTLTLGGSYGGTNEFSGVISGAGNLGSSGSGTWVLSGANTRTGGITVNGGTLRAGNASAFGTTTGLTVNSGTLDLNSFNLAATSLAGTGGTVALDNANLALTLGTGVNNIYAGSITGSGGSLTKLGAGTLTLTGQSNYTGATNIGGGALKLDFSAAGAPTSDIISSASTLNISGGGLTVNGTTGQTQNFAATNITAGGNTIAGTGNVNIDLGAVNWSGGLVNFVLPGIGSIKTTPTTVLGGWATVTSGTTTDYAQVDASGNIIARTVYANKDNAGTWATGDVVSDEGGAANTPYSGSVVSNVQLGGLKYTVARASTVTIDPSNRLGIDGAIIVSSSVGGNDQTITGGQVTGLAAGGALGILQNSSGNFKIGSTIVDASGGITGFTKAGAGLVTLSGANTYTGATTVSEGTLAVTTIANGGTASAIGASNNASSNLVIQGATLQYTGATASSDRGLTLATNGAATVGTIDVSQANTDLEFAGVVTSPDNAGLTKTGAGKLILSGANNTYKGVTTVNKGTLAVSTLANGGANSSIGASSNASSNLVLQNGGELEYTGATASSNRGFTLGTDGGAIDVALNTTVLTLSGVATGAGALIKNGDGTLVLSGTNNYTGGTTVNGGTLRAGSASAFNAGPMTVDSGGTLDLAGYATTVRGLNGAGNVQLGGATLTITGTTGSFSGSIGGSGGVNIGIFQGAVTSQTFSGCGNSYTGATTIQSGHVLSVDCLANGGTSSGIGASSSASSNLVFINGKLNYTGGTVATDRGFSMPGGAGGTIGVQSAQTTLTFSGQVTGAGGVQKDGPGTLVLSGTNTYGLGTGIVAGTLRAGSTSAFGTGPMTVNAGAVLDLASLNNTVGGLAGAGNVTLGSSTLSLSDGMGLNFSGAISGSGGLVKNGTGTQTLSGSSSYTGPTVINGGILAVTSLVNGGSTSSIGSSTSTPDKLVLSGGTLQYIGAGGSTDRQFTLGANGGSLDASGTGAINFTRTAPITLSGTGNSNLTLTGTNTADNRLAVRIDNPSGATTSLTKTGGGTWILQNPESTYGGITRIEGGVLGVDKLADGGLASSIGQSSNDASNLIIGTESTLRYTGSGDTTDRLFTLSTGVSYIESSGSGAIVFINTGSAAYSGNGDRILALGGTNVGFNTMGGTIIDGPGGKTRLAKNDSGTWVLTGNNSYSGDTIINDGNLMIGNGGLTGNAGTGNVTIFNPTSVLSLNRSNTFTFSGNLNGPGSLAQIGTGTSILTSATNSIGAARIDNGVLQVGNGTDAGSLTTATLALNGPGTLVVAANATVGATGGATTTVTGDSGSSTITVSQGGTLRASGDLGGGADTVNVSGTLDTGSGTKLNLGAGNDILVLNDSGTIAGGGVDAGTGGESGKGDMLQVVTDAGRVLDGASITNFESLLKQGTGMLTLTGDHSYSAGTEIQSGVLQIGNGSGSGTLDGDILNNATLRFNRTGALTLAGIISGTGSVEQVGGGITVLTGANSYKGDTFVRGGTLIVDGNQSLATGSSLVENGGILGGNGTIGGNVTVQSGGAMNPGSAGDLASTLTIAANVVLEAGSLLNFNFGQANTVGGPLNDLIRVGGDLDIRGATLNVNVTPGGDFAPGIYRVAEYGGNLSNNQLALGTTPGGSNASLQTSIRGQVNLINSAGLTLNYWDGDAGPKNNDNVDGGNGTWRAGGDDNWTDSEGRLNGAYANNSFAIFQGIGGTVTVDGAGVGSAGIQFAVNGYTVEGGTITLTGDQAYVRVGVGSVGADYTATIGSELAGGSELVKDDVGTLVLTGTNSYTGGTRIEGGTLQVSGNQNLGHVDGGLTFNGGTLQTTTSFASDRAVTLEAQGGGFLTNAATTLTLTSDVTGGGVLLKSGTGTLVLAEDNTYGGGTVIADGTLQVGNGGGTGSIIGNVANDGLLAFNRTGALTYAGAITGIGALNLTGGASYTFIGHSNYSGNTTINGSQLTLSGGGAITGTGATILQGFNEVLTVSGAGSAISTGTLRAGVTANSVATVNIENGGAVTVTGDAIFSDNVTSNTDMTLAVSGKGSLLDVRGRLTLGGGSGVGLDAIVADGAAVRSGNARIGTSFNDGAGKQVTLSGLGTTWTNANLLRFESGTLSVLDGAAMTTGSAVIAPTASTTTLLVSGTGSRFAGMGDVTTGGNAIITLANGGEMSVGGQFILANAATGTAVLNIGGGEGAAATGAGTLDAATLTFGPGTSRLNFNHTEADYGFATALSGAGSINQMAGVTRLTGASSAFSGATTVNGGTLLVDGTLGNATSTLEVLAGTLGGTGTIGGDVQMVGGTLSPGNLGTAPGTLAINGDLTLSVGTQLDYNFGQAGVEGGAFNDLVRVGGDLVLEGTLNVTQTAGGNFGPGLYRIIGYDGALTGGTLGLGAMPSGTFYVQTSIDKQVNLVNATGQTVSFWDGPDGGLNDGNIHGGTGDWRLADNVYWTDHTGAANAPYANGSFAVFAGQSGTVNVDNSNGAVEAAGMQFAVGGYVLDGEPLTLVGGSSLIRVGDGTLDSNGMTATIDAELTGTSRLVKDMGGTLVLSGTNTYTGGTTVQEGRLRVSADKNLGDAAGGLTLDGGTLQTSADMKSVRAVELASTGTFETDNGTTFTLNGSLQGVGGFTKAGGGTLVLAGASSYDGVTAIREGILRAGAAEAISGSSTFTVASGGTLDLAGFDQTVAGLGNAGSVHLGGGAAGTTLTVTGAYTGNGGTILLNTVLGEDNSVTDRLVIEGASSGNTTLVVNNIGGRGAQTLNGIKVVDVMGASGGTFSLQGDYVFKGQQAVVGGAYAYRLYKNGVSDPADGDWYLRSTLKDPQNPGGPQQPDPETPLYQAGVPLYEAYAGALQSFNDLETLQQRTGNRVWNSGTGAADNTVDHSVIWARIKAAHAEYQPDVSTSNTDYDVSTWQFQAGADGLFHDGEAGSLIGGLYAHYGTLVSRVDSVHGAGQIDATGYGVGGALTWSGGNGFYLDGQARVTWFDSDLATRTAGRVLASDNHGMGYSVSIEAGQRVALGGVWSITPQAQLSYASITFDDFTDTFGTRVSLAESNSLIGRLGVTIDREMTWQDQQGRTSRSYVYGIANLYHDFKDGSRVYVGDTAFASENDALWGAIGIGGSLSFADDKYAVYGEALAKTGLQNFGDSRAVSASMGVRVRW